MRRPLALSAKPVNKVHASRPGRKPRPVPPVVEVIVTPLAPEDPKMKALLELLFPGRHGDVSGS